MPFPNYIQRNPRYSLMDQPAPVEALQIAADNDADVSALMGDLPWTRNELGGVTLNITVIDGFACEDGQVTKAGWWLVRTSDDSVCAYSAAAFPERYQLASET